MLTIPPPPSSIGGHLESEGIMKLPRFPRLSPASALALAALFFALGGGAAVAANHYLITSTKQIKPSVLKQLKGARGPAGPSATPAAALPG